MADGMGIANESGKTMALTLTGLSGDLASFYNTTEEIAKTALSSVFTGETESLKKFGIVLTDTNLQQFAYTQGITKAVSAMSQAEKVALRYQYVLQSTSKIQGDFARTSGSWANQVKILKAQWQELLTVLGTGLKTILTPLLKVMNQILASVISVANAIAKAFGGTTIQETSSTVGEIADSVDDTASGFEDANTSAKKLSKTLAGFDELNRLNSQDTSGSTGGSISGTASLVEGIEYESPVESANKYFTELQTIVSKWTEKLPELQLNFDKNTAISDLSEIGKNIVNTLAGWGTFLITMGIDIANDLDIGLLANDFLSLLSTVTGLGAAVTETLVPAFRTFYTSSGLQDIVKWIGEHLHEALTKTTSKLEEWKKWWSDSENQEKVQEFAENLGNAISPISKLLLYIADAAWAAFATTVGLAADGVERLGLALLDLDTAQLLTLVLTITALSIAINGIIKAFKYANENSELGFLKSLIDYFDLYGESIKLRIWDLQDVISRLFTTLTTNPIAMIIALIAVAIASVIALYNNSEKFREFVDELWNDILKPIIDDIGSKISDLWDNHLKPFWEDSLKPMIELIMYHVKRLWEDIYTLLGWIAGVIGGVLLAAVGEAFDFIVGAISSIIEILGGIIDYIVGVFTGDWEKAWGGVTKILKGVFNGIINIIECALNFGIDAINVLIKALNKIDVPDWVPLIGGKGINIPTISRISIPRMASGGVIDSPTVALMGEYQGAGQNPEIVTPQALLQEIINNGNESVISTLIQMTKQLISTLEGLNMEVSIGDETIAKSANRGNKSYEKRTGKPLFA